MVENLKNTVIDNGYCIGCGMCAVYSNNFEIKLNDWGQYVAHVKDERIGDGGASKVCPFSNNASNELEVIKKVFHNNDIDEYLGSTVGNYFGYSNKLRTKGASGGLTSWFLKKLLVDGLVDGIIHLTRNPEKSEALFSYSISYSAEEVIKGAKTKYFPGELSRVFKEIINNNDGKKYAVVGVPCFVKATRLLTQELPELNQAIQVYIGLICGHYKTTKYAEMLALQKNVDIKSVSNFDFRHKPGYGRAGDYHTKFDYLIDENGQKTVDESVRKFYGTDWGLGMFKYKACDFCDDIVGETADISFGDAWIKPYNSDHKGTNVVVIRQNRFKHLFKASADQGEITLINANKEDVVKTQFSGFRHRREGLSIRLYWSIKNGIWTPKKRVNPSNNISIKYKIIFKMREIIMIKSHKYYQIGSKYNSFLLFKLLMFPYVFFYKYVIYGIPRIKNLLNR